MSGMAAGAMPQALPPTRHPQGDQPPVAKSAAAAPPTRGDGRPKERLKVATRVRDGVLLVAAPEADFFAEMEIMPARHPFIAAPLGMLVPNICPEWLRIQTAHCQMCCKNFPFENLTRAGQLRCFRRLYRALTSGTGETECATSRIVCKGCGGGDCEVPKSYIQSLVQRGIMDVEVEFVVRVKDAAHTAAQVSRTYSLGKEKQQKFEAGLYAEVAEKIRKYWEDPTNPVDAADPNTDPVDSDVDMDP